MRYDLGNSAFATAVVAVILPVYFQSHVVPDAGVAAFGSVWSAESLWALVTGIGPMIMLLVMPIVGAAADRSGMKSRLLLLTSYGCATLTVGLYFATERGVAMTLGVFLAALLCYAAANVFYDGLLTDVASPDQLHRVSSRGIAAGYVGGGVHLVIVLVVIAVVGTPTASRAMIASTGVWFAVFTALAWRDLRVLPDRRAPHDGATAAARTMGAAARTLETLRRVRRVPDLARFVAANMLYGNALQSFVLLTAVYSAQTLGLGQMAIIIAFLSVQVLSVPACLGASRLASRFGGRRTLSACLVVWLGVFVGAFLLPAARPLPFFLLAITVGFVLGPVTAISRSLFASMVPEESTAHFFGFFSLATRLSSISGPLVFAWVRQSTGSGRVAIVSLAGFLVVGLILLQRVDVARARDSRHLWSIPSEQLMRE